MKLCLECNKPILSHCVGTLRHRACFVKFRAFDKKVWTKNWVNKNKDKIRIYTKISKERHGNKCLDCKILINRYAMWCKKCRYKHPEFSGRWKGGITKDKAKYSREWRCKNMNSERRERANFLQKVNNCVDCGKPINRTCKRCAPCFYSHPELQSNYKDGRYCSKTPSEYLKYWRKTESGILKWKRSVQRRFAIRRGGGILKKETIQGVYEDNIKKYGTLTCYLCLKSIEFGKDALEHNIPLSRGGTNEKENLEIAHKGCNSRKKDLTAEEYFKKMEANH